MLLIDITGSSFDSGSIETVLEGSNDPLLGELQDVRLRDGSIRTVKAEEIELASRNDRESYPSFGSW